MEFEYDKKKSESNTKKHGLDFEKAKLLWQSPYIEFDSQHVDDPRKILIGLIEAKLFTCIFTYRTHVVRIISVRRSHKIEDQIYHEHIQET